MAKIGASNTRLCLDGLDLSGFANNLTQNINQQVADARGFDQLSPDGVFDGYGHDFSVGAAWDGDQDQIDQVLERDQDTHYLFWVPNGYTAENIAYFSEVKIGDKPIAAPTGTFTTISATFPGESGISRGVLLDTRTVTAAVDSTGQNLGATSAGERFAVQIHVVSGTFSDLDITIEESSDDGSADAYTAISGFTQSNISGTGAFRLETTSATESWKRVSYTAFTGTSALVHVVAGTVTGG